MIPANRIFRLTLIAVLVMTGLVTGRAVAAKNIVVTNLAEKYSLSVSFPVGTGGTSNWKLERRIPGQANDQPTSFQRSMIFPSERGTYQMTMEQLGIPHFSTFTSRDAMTLKKGWNQFVNAYLDEWLHQKNNVGQEIYRQTFHVTSLRPITIRNYHATEITFQELAGPKWYTRYRMVLVSKDMATVYRLLYQVTKFDSKPITVKQFNRYSADFTALVASFKIL